MIDMFEVQKYFNLQWAGKLVTCANENWSYIPRWHLEKLAMDFNAFDFNCRPKTAKRLETVHNHFWKDVLITYLSNKTILTENDISINNFSNQLLFNNQLIRYKGNTVYFAHWQRKGLEKVKDIIHINEKRLLSLEEIQNIVEQNKATTIFQYNALINALPTCWKEWIRDGNYQTENIENREPAIYNTKPKYIKRILENKSQGQRITSHACTIWQQKLNVQIDEKVWLMPRKATKEVRLRELQWKIVHRIYPTNIILQKMKVSETNKCTYCVDTTDYLEHFFFECIFVKRLWEHIESLIASVIGKRVKLTKTNVLFGIDENYLSEKSHNFVNHLLLIGKVCISIAKKTKLKPSSLIILFEHNIKLRKIDEQLH